ncbi:TPA: hypothetical protein ACH3X3_010989 [Trebouxia sp. C0006]
MTRLGFPRTSDSLTSEQDMKMAIKACLTACAHLHAAKPLPICHCDVRLANVLWDPQPFLTDVELAHFSPWQVLLDVPLQDWDEGTLNEKGQYTPESDVYQIGVMLLKFQELSTASRAFADKPKSKSLSAADAAEDTYFLYSNVAFVTKNLGRLHCTAHAVLYRCLPMLSLFHESLVVLSRSAFFQTVI